MIDASMPPFDVDAEGAVLSACLVRGAEAVDEIADILGPPHFYAEKHRRIFEACVALAAESRELNLVTVGTRLRDTRRLDQAGGAGYLVEVANSAPYVSSTALRAYAESVRGKAMLREVLATCQRAAAEIYAGVPEIDPFVQELEAGIHAATLARRMVSVKSIEEVLRGAINTIIERERDGGATGIPSGLADLDGLTGGLHRSDLTVVAARPGMGKTSLALCQAVEVAKRGFGVMIFSLEMPSEQFGNRAMCLQARVNMQVTRAKSINATDMSRLLESVGVLGKLPIFIEDTADLPISAMRTVVRRKQTELAKDGRTLGLVVIDYLQLMSGRSSRDTTRDQQVSEITRGLKGMAKEADVAVMALSQLNREVEKRADKRPLLSDLRESGAIEQDADNVIFIYRDDYYDETKEPNVAELNVAKQRNGPVGTVKVRFDGKYTRFDNLGYEDAAQ
jgi:replicative DNA helicase